MQTLQTNSLLQGGRYKIISTLGQGGFGITYLAIQSGLERKVAIKEFFMKEHCNRDVSTSMVNVPSVGSVELVNRFKEKFLKEARTIAGLNNHHIVQIHDIFEENGTAYYVMEYMDGGSLDEMLKQSALSEDAALKYVREIADALQCIHAQNILHLDVKPANVLMRSNGECALIDFGISKRYDDEGGQTSTTPVAISKGFAPVEQYNQGLTNFTPATDIYSLGATLYKMVTGKTPPEASLLLDEDEELERPSHVTFNTWVAIEKAMEPRRKKRPQSIDEFLMLLGHSQEPNRLKAEETVPKPQKEETVIIGELENAPEEINNTNILEFCVKGVKFNMIRVEGGSFEMKETVNCGFLYLSEKEIIQPTSLSDYFIGETQVTQALWKAVMDNNPSFFKGDNKPVDQVSWHDCNRFILKLNSLTGQKFRLPTEAEWEFAARGGNKSCQYPYSGSEDINEVAWYDDNSGSSTHDVATKKTNELGIYDMTGNVWEWCIDWYGNYSSTVQINPSGPNSGNERVCRGGCWHSNVKYSYLWWRFREDAGLRYFKNGLRLALSMKDNITKMSQHHALQYK
ncbi:MAG: bifunctional serine/threonine-protein kinase/formylglycine-generating enzyme family protein [Bacteroidaceae bacterium]|nr:bifunctional serine/threonine-protein kinase/formylglycine-generating enzyme family protein [Bacteroidaceae bacterium]